MLDKDLNSIVDKIELSHQAIANSISAYGDQTKRLQIRFDEITSKLDSVIVQTTKTNGSVRTLQIWQAGAKGWLAGVGICLSVMLTLVATIFWLQVGTINASIDNVKEQLNQHIFGSTQTK